jgi:hypothetical protein
MSAAQNGADHGPPLVDQLARLLERTYDIDSGVVPVGRFVVGDEGQRRLLEGRTVRQRVDGWATGARLLLRRPESGPGWAAALYLSDGLVEHLERHDPRRSLSADNVDEFGTLVEEIDHLVTFAERAAHGAEITLFELEWHAAVSKYLVLSHFAARLAHSPHLPAEARAFIERRVFHGVAYSDPDPAVRSRYEDAYRLGWRFVRALHAHTAEERLATLRRFHRASHQQKLQLFAA